MSTPLRISTITEEQCWKYVAVVVHPLYRTMQCIHIILCAASILLLIYVFTVVCKRLMLHYNIKVLFIALYSACMLHATVVFTFHVYSLIVSVTFEEPCEVIIPQILYILLHVPFGFSVLWIEHTVVLMFVERGIATLFFRYYDKHCQLIGNILLFLEFALPIISTLITYVPKNFDAPEISALNTPSGGPASMNIVFGTFTVVNVISVLCAGLLHIVNSRKSSIGDSHLDLTAKYRMAENALTARFLTNITSGQLVIFTIYFGTTFWLRMSVGSNYAAYMTDPYYKSYIMMAYTIPLYTVVLPIITIYSTRSSKNSRRKAIDIMLQIRAVGEEGWQNYAKQMKNVW